MATMPERVSKLEADVAVLATNDTNHEKVCADRWGILIKLIGGGMAIMVALSGFGLKALYTGQQRQLDVLQSVQLQVAHQDPATH